jgi:hypothetical protein
MVRERVIHRVDDETWVVWDASIEDPDLERDLENAKRELRVRIGPRVARISEQSTPKPRKRGLLRRFVFGS